MNYTDAEKKSFALQNLKLARLVFELAGFSRLKMKHSYREYDNIMTTHIRPTVDMRQHFIYDNHWIAHADTPFLAIVNHFHMNSVSIVGLIKVRVKDGTAVVFKEIHFIKYQFAQKMNYKELEQRISNTMRPEVLEAFILQ